MKNAEITTLFLDIGGVLLTNGWDRQARERAVEHFGLNAEETNERHHLTFDTYESGKLTLDDYLNRVVFYTKRKFTKDDFRTFMFNQSKPLSDDSLTYFKKLKKQYKLKVLAVSNEGRELNEHRIHTFKLRELFDGFVSSCYVHFRKPDIDLFRIACDISQSSPDTILYVDDRLMFVEVARTLGLRGLHYEGLDSAKKYIKTLKFSNAHK